MPHGIGQIARIAGASGLFPRQAAEAANQVQRFLLNETRLGIPALIREECLSGFMAAGATTSPQSIGMASTFEPELMERNRLVAAPEVVNTLNSYIGQVLDGQAAPEVVMSGAVDHLNAIIAANRLTQ